MKKWVFMTLTAVCVLSLAACGKAGDTTGTAADDEEIVGGWDSADSPEITEEIRAIVEKAAADADGVTYTPVAYLKSQVVAGMNHTVLCKEEALNSDAQATYVILTIYEDLQGNAEITEILQSDANAETTDLDGGWAAPASPVVTDEAMDALTKASEDYRAVALLATQVVAGMNYALLCEDLNASANGQTAYAVVYVYADLQGGASITDTVSFVAESDAQ